MIGHTSFGYDAGFNKGYKKGRADQKEEDNAFFNFEGAWELEKKKCRVDVIEKFATRLEEELTMVMPRDKVKYLMYKVHTVLEKLKEQMNE